MGISSEEKEGEFQMEGRVGLDVREGLKSEEGVFSVWLRHGNAGGGEGGQFENNLGKALQVRKKHCGLESYGMKVQWLPRRVLFSTRSTQVA
jgi:hypothetical protein